MKIGYARVSTQDQNLDLQIDDLTKIGCEKIYHEKASSGKERPQLMKMVENLREGDSVTVWKLDRLCRSLKELINLVELFQARKVNFISIKDSIDTSTAQGRLFLNIFGSLAEFERDIIRERTKAGLSAAKARGRTGGRKKGLTPEATKKAEAAVMLYKQKKSADEIAGIIGVGRATVYRYLAEMDNER
ncbi:recombinase family protein [Arcicella sp. LKC2W]|uniref:recombinase family protein n=1 Tax=Arcicella sp. LKC2W TaxID=2984198 RepID=UPI002B211F5F|nr:recombinase family protein [Arcicella sp. LKC2W]MEA5461673.1 recombinase family protein [Arcicella sp. LKC2W]